MWKMLNLEVQLTYIFHILEEGFGDDLYAGT